MQMGWFPTSEKRVVGPAAGLLDNAAMDLWDIASEEEASCPTYKDPSVGNPAQMWEEARAIASRIRLPKFLTTWCDFPRTVGIHCGEMTKRVYKFVKSEHGISALEERKVKLSLIDELNDPFDMFRHRQNSSLGQACNAAATRAWTYFWHSLPQPKLG
jgi:hypothetical protein